MKTHKLQLTGSPIRICSFLILMLVFIQCRGPRGYDGLDGFDGFDGINYTHSVIYDVTPASWEGSVDGYFATLDVPEITNDIYYEGAVLVYWLNEVEPKNFTLLPYTYFDNGLIKYLACDIFVGSIDLFYQEVFENVNDTFAPGSLWSFKIVIIEGIPLASLKTMVNISDFTAVSKMFNIENSNRNIQ